MGFQLYTKVGGLWGREGSTYGRRLRGGWERCLRPLRGYEGHVEAVAFMIQELHLAGILEASRALY